MNPYQEEVIALDWLSKRQRRIKGFIFGIEDKSVWESVNKILCTLLYSRAFCKTIKYPNGQDWRFYIPVEGIHGLMITIGFFTEYVSIKIERVRRES